MLEPGDAYAFDEPEKELALDLLIGRVEFCYGGEAKTAERPDTFHYAAWCLHVLPASIFGAVKPSAMMEFAARFGVTSETA